jgi:hypothetical protein
MRDVVLALGRALTAQPSAFVWQPGVTPGSNAAVALTTAAIYVVLALAGRAAPWARAPRLAAGFKPLHNLVLSVGSAVMFAGALSAGYERGLGEWLFCLPQGETARGALYFWSYVYYLSKFYELLDTALIVLSDKPLSALHVWHHAVVILMSWLWLEHAQSLQLIAMLTNTGVHVIMYSYYFLTSVGIRPPWKKLVTNIQIVQFVFSFAVSMPLVWMQLNGGGCQGFGAWGFNAAFNATLLVLFWDFHRRSYKAKRGTKSGGDGGAAANSVAARGKPKRA